MDRRKFIRNTVLGSSLLSMFPADISSMVREKEKGKLEKRVLGKTGVKLSILGFGGIVVRDATVTEASERVREAIRYGVNYFDVAPSYGDAEVKLGPALEPYRKKVFLACKTRIRTKEDAYKELIQSLDRLRTDYFDLYQLHGVTTLEDVDTIFSSDGVIHTLLKAREEGKIRYLGFSAHSVEAAMELMKRFDFDTILFPINFATWHGGNFGPQVLELAQKKDMGILAIKAMAERRYKLEDERKYSKVWYRPLSDPEEASLALRFTLSHPVTSAIPPGNEELFRMGLRLGLKYKPLSTAEVNLMKQKGLDTFPMFSFPAD